jgi:hypothetical protein
VAAVKRRVNDPQLRAKSVETPLELTASDK